MCFKEHLPKRLFWVTNQLCHYILIEVKPVTWTLAETLYQRKIHECHGRV